MEKFAEPARKPTGLDIVLLIVMGAGLLMFASGIMIGITINPYANMHGRMVAYAFGLGGLTVGVACMSAMEKKAVRRIILAFFAGASAVTFAYQLTQTF